mgnify:CR=1 FL=1
MSTIKDGGPAFPVPLQGDGEWIGDPQTDGYFKPFGMTLRDYFAAKAMAALINEPMWGEGSMPMVLSFSKGIKASGPDRFAIVAYALADAMLRAREVQS